MTAAAIARAPRGRTIFGHPRGLAVLALTELRDRISFHGMQDRGVEPGAFTKLAIGCLIFAVGTAWLGAAGLVVDASGRTPLLWAVVFHGVSNLGWLYFAPSATALFTRCAPRSVNGLMIGVLSLSVTVGSLISGRLGGLYESLDSAAFWLLHAAVVGVGGVLFWVIGKSLGARYFGAAPTLATACP